MRYLSFCVTDRTDRRPDAAALLFWNGGQNGAHKGETAGRGAQGSGMPSAVFPRRAAVLRAENAVKVAEITVAHVEADIGDGERRAGK